MVKTENGWAAQVKLGPGKYWYKFVVDGNWITDPDNLVKENDGRGNTNSVFFRPNTIFRLRGYSNAKRVYLAGSFNNWRTRDLQLQKTLNGWELPLYLAQGTHTYRFIVDGEWITDPDNKNRLPNEFNDFNSVIRLGNPYVFKLPGNLSARQVVLSGSFNNWREDELFMLKTDTGWELPYTLGPGNYQYKFKVDGKWLTDPANPQVIQNGKSGGNSFLIINPNYTFRLKGHLQAKSVYLAGDFNDWSPTSLLMKKEQDGWAFRLHLSPGKTRYKFIVDGEWIKDPDNKLWEQNEYGTGNSIIWLDR
jgi:1,4-alpha-glucan branching enzyme